MFLLYHIVKDSRRGERKKILVIEGNELFQRFKETILEKRGMKGEKEISLTTELIQVTKKWRKK